MPNRLADGIAGKRHLAPPVVEVAQVKHVEPLEYRVVVAFHHYDVALGGNIVPHYVFRIYGLRQILGIEHYQATAVFAEAAQPFSVLLSKPAPGRHHARAGRRRTFQHMVHGGIFRIGYAQVIQHYAYRIARQQADAPGARGRPRRVPRLGSNADVIAIGRQHAVAIKQLKP